MKRGSRINRYLDRWFGIPAVAVATLVCRKHDRPVIVKSIGFIAAPALGDTFLTSAAVLDAKKAFPEAKLHYFATRNNAGAVRLIPGIDEVTLIDYQSPAQAIRTLRDKKLDVLFDFTQWHRATALYSAASGAQYRVGFKSLGQARHYLYDKTAVHSPLLHEYVNFQALVAALDVPVAAKPRLTYTGSQAERKRESQIVFHPWPSGDLSYLREWSADNWIQLARRLRENADCFKVTGSQADAPRTQQLVSLLREADLPAEPVHGSDGLGGLCDELQKSSLVVSVNTGIMHLAAILGVPTIALNGPTSTLRWGPVGPYVESVEPRGGGGGFLHFGYEFSGNPRDTMARIHVEDVHEAALNLLPKLQREAQTA
jgi:ADP-heptose:LPS heptosyltransferase